MRIQFSTANQIFFGEGVLKECLPNIAALGRRFLVISGQYRDTVDQIIGELGDLEKEPFLFLVAGEPDLNSITAGVDLARRFQVEVIVAVGGGSVLDTGKTISGLMANPGELVEYLEVIGAGRTLSKQGPPVIAIPTTAGTGAEVTRNAVIGVPERHVKVSLRSPYLMPQMAIVDPELTYSLPPEITAATGMDALTQLIEPFLSIRANPLTDLFCKDGIRRIRESLLMAYHDGGHRLARREMSYASLLGGLSLANAGLGGVHGFAGPIGGLYLASHGAICARLLSPVIKANYSCLKKKDTTSNSLLKFEEVARLALGNPNATVYMLLDWFDELCAEMKIPRLRDMGVLEGDFEKIVDLAAVASSMKANPVKLEKEDLLQILAEAW